jgi:hypothetical protein
MPRYDNTPLLRYWRVLPPGEGQSASEEGFCTGGGAPPPPNKVASDPPGEGL